MKPLNVVCGQAEQLPEHLYTMCGKWRKEQRKLLRNLYNERVRWEGLTEKKGLAEFLANERAVEPLV